MKTTETKGLVRANHPGTHPQSKPSRLWLWFVAAFLLQFGVWGAWIRLAAKHKVAEVPLATAQHHKR